MRKKHLRDGVAKFMITPDTAKYKTVMTRIDKCASCTYLTFAGMHINAATPLVYYKCGGCNCTRDIVFRLTNLQLDCPKKMWNNDDDDDD